MEISDLQFRVSRAEHNEKILQERLSSTNTDYAGLLNNVDQYDTKINNLRQEIKQLTDEKNDAEDLVEKKRAKLKICEDRIRALEEQLKEKNTECQNRIRAYDRMKKENVECKKTTGKQ
jgi:peptidoglycan hydrolase CwlO-like protein